MSVAAHLQIPLEEYDDRIRTFIPGYDAMLDAAARIATLAARRRHAIVDLGIGTGSLAERCLRSSPAARVIGVDVDPDMLAAAKRRLVRRGARRATLLAGDFAGVTLPRCDAITAALSLHHIRTSRSKVAIYGRCHQALSPGGALVIGDCVLPDDEALREEAWNAWRRHLRRSYSPAQTRAYFEAWAKEDRYFLMSEELQMLRRVGFHVDVGWRDGAFAVIVARRQTRADTRTRAGSAATTLPA